jgi:hypothetical protein
MAWKKWLKMAMEYQLRIVNWPKNIQAPGPAFDFKSISAHDLANLVKELVECDNDEDLPELLP